MIKIFPKNMLNTSEFKFKKSFSAAFLLLAGLFIYFPGEAKAATTTSISQYGMTWNFSEPVEYGQFVNGDYWVVDSGSGVTISTISPTPSETTNGTMVNPVVDGKQCLDSRANNYAVSVCASFPLVVSGGDSVLSSISVGEGGITTDWAGGSIDSHTFVAAAAILTIMSSAPPEGSFRPAYTDRTQQLYNVADLDMSKLPNLPPAENPARPLSYYERGLERPWIMFLNNWTARSIHAVQNMYEYHREISSFLSNTTLLMMTDTEGLELLVQRFCQLGIDAYYIGLQGTGDSSYYVPPTLYTGILLNDDGMKNFFTNGLLLAEPRDYPDFYYWQDQKSTIKSAIVPEGRTWNGHTVFFRNQIGGGEHEHLHPSEWDVPTHLDHWKNDSYRRGIDSHVHVGMALSALLMGNNAKELWGHDATFDYIDRWMNEDRDVDCLVLNQYNQAISCDGSLARGSSSFINTMWDTYRPNYPYQLNFRSDVDNSSQINTTDALLTLRNSLGLSMSATAWQIWTTTGDANCDGDSNSTDALLILRNSLGLSMSGTTWCGDMTN